MPAWWGVGGGLWEISIEAPLRSERGMDLLLVFGRLVRVMGRVRRESSARGERGGLVGWLYWFGNG